MGLFDSLKRLLRSVDTEYDRRIKAASNVKEYDPTGALHAHAHVEVHNEHLEEVEGEHGTNGHVVMTTPSPDQQNTPPREVAQH